MIKRVFLIFIVVVMSGCSRPTIDSNDYSQTMDFLNDNFELNYSTLNAAVPEYLEDYDVKEVSDNITMALNASGQIVSLQFTRLTDDEAKMIIDELGKELDDELQLLLESPDNFKEKYEQSYLVYEEDTYGLHVLGLESEIVEARNISEPYSINVFYNSNIFHDFMNE